jgi:hypothetical protein
MRSARSLLIRVLALSLMLTVSCKDSGVLVGKYLAENERDQRSSAVLLELGTNGEGSWAIEEDNAFFKWEVRTNEVWLHTDSGGVIVGRIVGDTIEISLPGVGDNSFRKVKE